MKRVLIRLNIVTVIYCLFIYIHVYLCKNVNSEGLMED